MSHDARALSSHYLNGSRRRWYVATVCMRARPPSRTMVVLCAVTAWPWKRPLGMQAHSAHEVDDARCHLMLPRPGMRWYPCGSWHRSHAHPATCQQGRMRACAAAKLGFACAAAKVGLACAAPPASPTMHQWHDLRRSARQHVVGCIRGGSVLTRASSKQVVTELMQDVGGREARVERVRGRIGR
jgi:hypothetical protein